MIGPLLVGRRGVRVYEPLAWLKKSLPCFCQIFFLTYPRCPQGWGHPMIALMMGAALSGLVLGATSRIIFLLPAALMALMIAAVLIVRADIDLGFTALAATLLNSGFLLGIVTAPVKSRLPIRLHWTVDEAASRFVGPRPIWPCPGQHRFRWATSSRQLTYSR